MYKNDTKQAFLYGDLEDDLSYITPPDWWFEPIPERHILQLLKSSIWNGSSCSPMAYEDFRVELDGGYQTMYFFSPTKLTFSPISSLFRQVGSLFRQVGSLFRQVGSLFRQFFDHARVLYSEQSA